jgi:hypothetical protein
MALNQYALMKFLYLNDNGEFLPISEFVTDETALNRIDYLSDSGTIELSLDGFEYNIANHANLTIENVKKGALKAKITVDGRWLYVRAYLAQDFIDGQSEVSKSTLTANHFIKLTFGAIAIGAVFQLLYIGVTMRESRLNREQIERLHTVEQAAPPQEVRIYLNDSLRTTDTLKRKQ